MCVLAILAQLAPRPEPIAFQLVGVGRRGNFDMLKAI
jgi:hypothetical protein